MSATRREAVIRRMCRIMGWDYHTSLVWAGLRKVALAEAVPVGLDKLEAIAERLEEANWLIDQLDCLAMPEYPSLYAKAQLWKDKTYRGSPLVNAGGAQSRDQQPIPDGDPCGEDDAGLR